MNSDKMEKIEQTAFSMIVQALENYKREAYTIFREDTDQPQDIAEDITREAIEKMGVSTIAERLYGKMDFKKAIYVFMPEPVAVALMVDAKAEKPNGNNTATIQMSQTSMRVKMRRAGKEFDEPGKLEHVITRGKRDFYVVTIIVKYIYSEDRLEQLVVSCIPNGMLQEKYNPTCDNTIWRAGRDAPSRGEDFRVRLSFNDLLSKADWRVRKIDY